MPCSIAHFNPHLLSEKGSLGSDEGVVHGIVRTLNAAAGVIDHLEFKLHLLLFVLGPSAVQKPA